MITGRIQRILGYRKGDCYRACIATITGIPYNNIPHFCANENKWWWRDTVRFLKFYKLNIFMINADESGYNLIRYYNKPVMAGGSTKRYKYNCDHMVVYRGDKMIFDPNPYGKGLKVVKNFTLILPNQSFKIENNRLFIQ